MADQGLFDHFAASGVLQVIGAELVVIDFNILVVDAGAVQMGHRLAFELIEAIQRHLHFSLRTGAEIARQRRLDRLPVSKARLVKAVEIELKAF